MVKLGLCISKPALLLNRIAQRYSRLSRILMEYVDNSLDDAEKLFHRGKKTYKKHVKITITVGNNPNSVVITDNCNGMDRKQMTRLIQNVGESEKHSRFTNGQFGFGVHAFRAAARHMRVVSKAKNKVSTLVLDIDRESMDFTAPRVLPSISESSKMKSGTQIYISDFDSAWSDGLDIDDIVKEIQFHFGGLLGRQNLTVTVKDQQGKSIICKPFDFGQIQGKKIKKILKVENQKCEARLWISLTPIENQGCYFISHGRRIHECHEIKSFMKTSQARWSCWSHPNLVGWIEVGDIVEPVITRDEFRRTAQRSQLYKLIVSQIEPIIVDQITKVNKRRRVLEMGRLGNILSKCFNVAVKKESQRTKGLTNYLDQMKGHRKGKGSKRKLPEEWTKPDPEELEAAKMENESENKNENENEENKADEPNPDGENKEDNENLPEPPLKKPKQEREKKIDKLRRVNGKFEMIFVNELKDAKGRMQRSLLVGEQMYVNVAHPDFAERVHTNRSGAKLSITERLCSYIANISANAYKAAIISRNESGLASYADDQPKLFREILDLNLSMESSLRKYLPAIQKEVTSSKRAKKPTA